MKTIVICFASLLFSTLFYGQHIGLNLSIFSVISIALLLLFNRDRFTARDQIVYLTMYALTAGLVFFVNSNLAILANCIAFFTLVGSFSNPQTSIFISWLNGLYTSIAGFFHRNFLLDAATEAKLPNKNIDVWHWVRLLGIPMAFIIIFTLLYQNGNPIFESLIASISFEFLNFQWLLFCLLGYYLFSNIVTPVMVDSATTADLSAGNRLKPQKAATDNSLAKELQLGVLLLSVLNILILFYLITDFIYINSSNRVTNLSLTEQVHNSVGALISSIVVAISILLFVFRGDLNFYKKNRNLKYLSYLWIALNVMLVATISVKNHEYILSYGLTYKRIGVYVYLLLTFIGLISTLLKIIQIKNLWFLFRMNTQAAFVILILSSCINWDVQITNYNLKYAEHLDLDYLIGLSEKNSTQLNLYRADHTLEPRYDRLIGKKYNEYLLKRSYLNWQELSYHDLAFSNQDYSFSE